MKTTENTEKIYKMSNNKVQMTKNETKNKKAGGRNGKNNLTSGFLLPASLERISIFGFRVF
jgi:hypothetical protein